MTLKDFFEGDKFAKLAGAELIEVGEGYARAKMEVGDEHLNGGGVCQGGALFTLARISFLCVRLTKAPYMPKHAR